MSTEIFNLDNDDYMWLNVFDGEKNSPTIKRMRLNDWAKKYDIDYTKYKNKKLLIKAMMELWELYFITNPDFKKDYEIKYYGEERPKYLPPQSVINIILNNN
jgi:hypothetical protein